MGWRTSLAVAVGCAVLAGGAARGQVSSGVDRGGVDTAVGPGEDFFQGVNGEWVGRNPIPADQTGWGAFEEVYEQNLAWLKEIAEGIPADVAEGDARKIRDFYRTAMDESGAERAGVAALKEELT